MKKILIYKLTFGKRIDNLIKVSLFVLCLQSADMTPIYKKEKKDFKGYHGPQMVFQVDCDSGLCIFYIMICLPKIKSLLEIENQIL